MQPIRSKDAQPKDVQHRVSLGAYKTVKSQGEFPSIGSTLGQFFSVGRLGKGTFCSIHRCINLNHFHSQDQRRSENDGASSNDSNDSNTGSHGDGSSSKRVVAAKLEIGEFQNSGVLAGEAAMLEFLDMSLPKETVPLYMGHLHETTSKVAAIIMEYLPGRDMHQIRDATTRGRTRRLTVENSVYLTADVMLPLLRCMHEVGIVHRDVKPSNCVKRNGRQFAMVDFGLSKSIVVPNDSALSDPNRPWKGKDWMKPANCEAAGHYRVERTNADFRGTSMYASLRIHQSKDYCPRDDLWSLLYVFCDLIGGGLPWMSYAASKERAVCHSMKERIHGEMPGQPDATHELLQGYEYHIAKARLQRRDENNMPQQLEHEAKESLPAPLKMSETPELVGLLRKAFQHLQTLDFCDMPDYDLVQNCLRGFLSAHHQRSIDHDGNGKVVPIMWEKKQDSAKPNVSGLPAATEGTKIPYWRLAGHEDDMLTSQQFVRAEIVAKTEQPADEAKKADANTDASAVKKLPLELQFRLAQMEHNAKHHTSIPHHIALHDWMQAASLVLYMKWDSKAFEKGGHRNNMDGYRRENFLRCVNRCLKGAERFGYFKNRSALYKSSSASEAKTKTEGDGSSVAPVGSQTAHIRHAIETSPLHNQDGDGPKPAVDLVMISRFLFGLRKAKRREEGKTFAPPPVLSFGSG